jgi:predicted transcriptional regulator
MPKVIASYSLEPEVKEGIDRLATQEHRSKSDILRDMYRSYRFNQALDNIQAEGRIIAARLGLETDEDVYRYLNEN